MKLKGFVHRYGDDVDTDVIMPAHYLVTTDPNELARHCMEGIDPEFVKRVKPGDIIVAGKNFGCGSSREHAPLAIKASGISCIIATTFARIFYRNAFNLGLPLLECIEASEELEGGEELEVNLSTGEIVSLEDGKRFQAQPVPPFMLELIRDGGLMRHVAKSLGLKG